MRRRQIVKARREAQVKGVQDDGNLESPPGRDDEAEGIAEPRSLEGSQDDGRGNIHVQERRLDDRPRPDGPSPGEGQQWQSKLQKSRSPRAQLKGTCPTCHLYIGRGVRFHAARCRRKHEAQADARSI